VTPIKASSTADIVGSEGLGTAHLVLERDCAPVRYTETQRRGRAAGQALARIAG
jgi:hypothetical protein